MEETDSSSLRKAGEATRGGWQVQKGLVCRQQRKRRPPPRRSPETPPLYNGN